jgi:hypothetical protein
MGIGAILATGALPEPPRLPIPIAGGVGGLGDLVGLANMGMARIGGGVS